MHLAIAFSFDEAFAPLGLGLVESLRALGLPNGQIALVHVDIGVGPRTQERLAAAGVRSVPFDPSRHFRFAVERAYYGAQLCRPLLPEIAPGFGAYLWLDADAWVQDKLVIETMLTGALQYPALTSIVPIADHSYTTAMLNSHNRTNGLYRIYNAALDGDQEQVKRYAFYPMLSTGAFAMAAACPNWSKWRETIEQFFPKSYYRGPFGDDRHGLEQLALNYVCYRDKSFLPLAAFYNYHCHERIPMRRGPDDAVCVRLHPFDRIGLVHLSCFPDAARIYLEEGLLFRRGAYLDAEGRAALSRIARYRLGDESIAPAPNPQG